MIAHASIGETGHVKSNKAGDQLQTAEEDILTGELHVRKWYSKPWTVVYEPPTEEIGERVAGRAKSCVKNRNIGYDQARRNTLLEKYKKAGYSFSNITEKCDCDCSSMITAVVIGAQRKYNKNIEEIMVVDGNSATTSTLGARLKKAGWIEHTESKYLNSPDYLNKGWILIKPGSHCVVNLLKGDKYGK